MTPELVAIIQLASIVVSLGRWHVKVGVVVVVVAVVVISAIAIVAMATEIGIGIEVGSELEFEVGFVRTMPVEMAAESAG